jgi:hypothetical protein
MPVMSPTRQQGDNANDRGASTVTRDFLSRVWRLKRGASKEPPTYVLPISLFLRALGVIYFIAFASLAVQMLGLYGSQGILPVADFMARQPFGLGNVWFLPTVFWLNTSDVFLQMVPMVGALLSLFLVFGFFARILRFLLFALYLSLVAAGQDFMAFQWDSLLLEVGFIAIFLGDGAASRFDRARENENTRRDAAPSANLIIWLYRWLLFRLMLLSGLVKILSGDPTWRHLTALDYHFETQPLPNVIGFFVYHLPSGIHQFMVAATFFIELGVPFFIFAPRRLRFAAGVLIVLLQAQIFLTGNYNFFNLLVIALCLLLLDDRALRAIQIAATKTPSLPAQTENHFSPFTCIGRFRVFAAANLFARRFVVLLALVLFSLSAFQLLALLGVPTPGVVALVGAVMEPLRVVNFYGPFAVMTTARPEIVIEGSNDGEHWVAYAFKYKPGDVHRAPPWVEPYQPRLDWQMWFAALHVRTGDARALLPELRANQALLFYMDNYGVDAWFVNFLERLLQGSPQVLALLDKNPFPDAPPRFVRARLYNYHFAAWDAPFTTGAWWTREERGLYLPALTRGVQ